MGNLEDTRITYETTEVSFVVREPSYLAVFQKKPSLLFIQSAPFVFHSICHQYENSICNDKKLAIG